MSFYRVVIAAVAALGLATSVLAAEEATQANQPLQVAEQTTETAAQAAATEEKVNLNTATAKELSKVKGLSSAKAKAIVSYRKKHGDFKAVEDLKMVKGFKKMKEEKMKEIADQLTVG